MHLQHVNGYGYGDLVCQMCKKKVRCRQGVEKLAKSFVVGERGRITKGYK